MTDDFKQQLVESMGDALASGKMLGRSQLKGVVLDALNDWVDQNMATLRALPPEGVKLVTGLVNHVVKTMDVATAEDKVTTTKENNP